MERLEKTEVIKAPPSACLGLQRSRWSSLPSAHAGKLPRHEFDDMDAMALSAE